KSEYVAQVKKLCLLGATDKDIANFFEVSESTLNNWKNEYPEFLESIKKGKMLADANVAERLYKRALGYEAPDVDIRVIENKIVETPLIKHYPPDPTSAIFWLKNRQPEKWRDKQVIDHTNSDSSLNRPTVIELVAPMVNADENPD
ncbi:TPA: helix-turn-helix domain-containing protein, partial [Pasteurella multocida]|nr:helix-turn-helix domain-containing protein [Pasteurella multocida]